MNHDFSVDTINRYIDQCNYNLTHYDVSVIVHKVFKSMYRYKGSNQWEYFDNNDMLWKDDKQKRKFRHDIKTVVSDLFITRYMHWYAMSNSVQSDVNSQVHAKFMADKMFRISYKLKDDKFLSIVIKEAQPFFDIYND
jgi:hypothetical protein